MALVLWFHGFFPTMLRDIWYVTDVYFKYQHTYEDISHRMVSIWSAKHDNRPVFQPNECPLDCERVHRYWCISGIVDLQTGKPDQFTRSIVTKSLQHL